MVVRVVLVRVDFFVHVFIAPRTDVEDVVSSLVSKTTTSVTRFVAFVAASVLIAAWIARIADDSSDISVKHKYRPTTLTSEGPCWFVSLKVKC